MDIEVAKAINKLSKKINSIQLQLDKYFSIKLFYGVWVKMFFL